MEEEFISYEQALALHELGFKLHRNIAMYDVNKNLVVYGVICYDDISAPLKQQVFRWFREKHECYANLSSWIHEEEIGIYHEFEIYKVKQYSHGSIRFKTYEEAENACIDKLIEIAKQQDSGKEDIS